MGIIYFVVLLGVIVTIHELGHFIAAKLFKVYVGEFAIGMGPKLFSIQGKETKYSLRLLPLGGYCQMAGDVDNAIEGVCDVIVPHERTLKGIARYKQIIIMLAGIFMNFILAWVLFSGIIMNQGMTTSSDLPIVGSVVVNSPAEQAGFQTNDKILSVEYKDGKVIEPKSFSEMSAANIGQESSERVYTIQRGADVLTLTVTPTYFEDRNAYMIGIGAPQEIVYPNILESAKMGAETMVMVTQVIFGSIVDLVKGNNLDQLSGPIGIYTVAEEQASLGMVNYIWLIAVLSLNVGIFNALPLPILDGGRVILSLIEAVRGKPINQKLEQGMMAAGLALMVMLMIYATWQDIARLFFK